MFLIFQKRPRAGCRPITTAAAPWLSAGPAGRLSCLVFNIEWGTSPAILTGTRATVAATAAVRPALAACFPGNGTLGFTGDSAQSPRRKGAAREAGAQLRSRFLGGHSERNTSFTSCASLFPAWRTEVMVEAPRDRRCPVPRGGWRREAAGAWLPGRILKLPSQLCTSFSLHPPLGNPEPSFVSAAEARLCRPQLLTATEDRNGITGPEVQRPLPVLSFFSSLQ